MGRFLLTIILVLLNFNSAYSAEGKGGMPQLNPEFWASQIFWLILIFGSLYIMLSKLILPKISNNLEARKSQITENIEAAERQRNESDEKLNDYEKKINDAKNEAKNILDVEDVVASILLVEDLRIQKN